MSDNFYNHTEADTRAELIDPMLKAQNWVADNDCKIFREFQIKAPRIGKQNAKGLSADYVLSYKNTKLAVLEAKKSSKSVSDAVQQAKDYAALLSIRYAIASNGIEHRLIDMQTGKESAIGKLPTPEYLWQNTFQKANIWRDRFNQSPFYSSAGKTPRYYQEIAVRKLLDSVANGNKRNLLTLATGTGKTFIAFQIAWKLYQTKWTLQGDQLRRPRILFLADRTILANQAKNDFNGFDDDLMVRITPSSLRKDFGKVPTAQNVYFAIFQTLSSGTSDEELEIDEPESEKYSPTNGEINGYFKQYPKDFFDFIIVDECHRGGANDESAWRAILEYFEPAYQLGLTATPKRKDNVDTYKYFGEPLYTYSLKQGIGDGYLTPYRIRRVTSNLDEYIYSSDDRVLSGDVDPKKVYTKDDFNRTITISEREKLLIQKIFDFIDPTQKTLVFCSTQDHAGIVRDFINEIKKVSDVNYCVRVTANDGNTGDKYLRDFQDNDKTIPTVLTTSRKLSTGVDARNVRNIVIFRPCKNMIEFKQIVGRGTRMFEGKDYFTIIDCYDAYKNFLDPEWDGEPAEPEPTDDGKKPDGGHRKPPTTPSEPREKIYIDLGDHKKREFEIMSSTMFCGEDGNPISMEEFLKKLFGDLPKFFKDENELRKLWSDPTTREKLLSSMAAAGYDLRILADIQKMIKAETSDIFDVLAFISYAINPITRQQRVDLSKSKILETVTQKQREFIEFILTQYVENGVKELSPTNLAPLLRARYNTESEGMKHLSTTVGALRDTFTSFQKYLYEIVN
jgi:type III restriction protein res subunit